MHDIVIVVYNAGVSNLLDTILREDSEHPKLKNLPGFDLLIADYRVNFERVTSEFVASMMRHYESKQCEKTAFETALQSTKKTNELQCIQKIQGEI